MSFVGLNLKSFGLIQRILATKTNIMKKIIENHLHFLITRLINLHKIGKCENCFPV